MFVKHHILGIGSAMIFAMTGSAGGGRTTDPQVVHVLCTAPTAERICQALATALGAARPSYEIRMLDAETAPADRPFPSLSFITEGASDHGLSGHLEWTDATGAAGQGPTIDVSIEDTSLQPQILDDYAAILLRETNLPF